MIKDKKIHLIGIGGISMQGLAHVLKKWGNEVSGSDLESSKALKELKKEGLNIHVGHDPSFLPDKTDMVVISDAIPSDNPELKKARELNVPVLRRAQMIQKMAEDKKLIAIAGTHGKSTLSAMVAFILEKTGYDPLAFLGAKLSNWAGVARDGRGEWAVTEACEYKGQFWFFKPKISLITNIEEEHMDYYEDLSDIKSSYLKFVNQTTPQGDLLVYSEDKNAIDVAEKSGLDFETYGGKNSDYPIDPDLKLKVFGNHNYLNATGALAVCRKVGVPESKAVQAITEFPGIDRRSQLVGRKNGVVVYDDYAHHPKEIKVTLEAFEKNFDKKFLVVFQPHQSERLASLFDGFKKVLKGLDQLVLVDTYNPAGRDKDNSKDAAKLAKELEKAGVDVSFVSSYDKAYHEADKRVKKGQLLLTMGAGPVNQVGERYLQSS